MGRQCNVVHIASNITFNTGERIMSRQLIVCLAAAIMVMLAGMSGLASANLIVNPNFDYTVNSDSVHSAGLTDPDNSYILPNSGTGAVDFYGPPAGAKDGTATLPGWTLGGDSGCQSVVQGSSSLFYVTPSSAAVGWAMLGSGSSISQTITTGALTPGNAYHLSVDFYSRNDSMAADWSSVKVLLKDGSGTTLAGYQGGDLGGSTTAFVGGTGWTNAFGRATVDYTAGASVTGLQVVVGLTGTADVQACFTNVNLDIVPEPGAFVLSATGLLGLLAYAWRKRK